MIEKKVTAFLEKHNIHLMDKSIAVGVSGGPDSLALLHFLWKMGDKWNLKLTAIHVDHMFRGEESYQDARFVEKFCRDRDIRFEMTQVNVPAYIEQSGKSSQVAARELRYRFFAEMMNKHPFHYLALAHHGDDQIETILMRLTRGSSGKARAGIPLIRPFVNGEIIRPFLCLIKEELESYCRIYQLEPRIDPSNEQDVYSRNRFRKYVLPFLKQENPQVHEHFQRYSEELENDERYLFELTKQKMNKVMEEGKGKVTLHISLFLELPKPLQRRGIKLILRGLYGENSASLSAIHIDHIDLLIRNPHPSGSLDFPNGLKVTRSYNHCHFEMDPPDFLPYAVEISGPGQFEIPSIGRIEAIPLTNDPEIKHDRFCFLVHINDFPLNVRTRKAGDRMTIKGMSGTKKLKDIFIDEKVPMDERKRWPVITDQNDHILWLPGLKRSNYTCSKENTRKLIMLKFCDDFIRGHSDYETGY